MDNRADLAPRSLRLTPDEDQEQLRASVRSFLARHCPQEETRRLMDAEPGWDEAVWARAAGQLGLAGLDVPEELGGSGASARELAVVGEELGRSLACLPWLSTVVLGAGALLLGDDLAAQERYLPSLADGSLTATLAVAEESGSWSEAEVRATAQPEGDAWVVEGTKSFVVDGATAQLVLVVARTAQGVSLFAVDGDAPGLSREPMRTLDPTRRLAVLRFGRAPAVLVGAEGDAARLLARVADRARLALAGEQTGVAATVLDMAVAYAGERTQFGRKIGSFQAVKHRCADIAQQAESARSALEWAVACVAEGSSDAAVAVTMAGIACGDAAVFTTAENVQVHGGIGFTWEHPAHLYFRRARSNAVLLGGAGDQREALLQRLGV